MCSGFVQATILHVLSTSRSCIDSRALQQPCMVLKQIHSQAAVQQQGPELED